MSELRSEFLRAIAARGFVHQCTDPEGLDALAARRAVVGYIGFDATADSLHVGSLVSIMLLRWLQRTGHKPIVLMGGGTTKVGDPSGKDETRRLFSDEEIAHNIASIRRVFGQFVSIEDSFDPATSHAFMVDNAEWLDELNYLTFLRDYGRHFTVNRMLTFESVRLRLEREHPLSFVEFNYMVLQAYDFVELARRYGCTLQMGGSDQWGNIVNGIELARRLDGTTLYGLTTPLITTASGGKMGKTAAGTVWLNPERLSAYDYWQYWRNVEDADVGRFLHLFTELPLDEVARLERLQGAEINEAKKALAFEATKLCRGAAAAEAAAETARKTFEERALGGGLPSIAVPRERLKQGIPAYELLREAGLAPSNSEGRKLIRGGGARLNDRRIEDEHRRISTADLTAEQVIKLSAGRKRHALVRAT